MSYFPETDSEDELPPYWVEKTNEEYVLYRHQQNDITQWTHPRTGRIKRVSKQLPFDWEKCIDNFTKATLFHNKRTKQISSVDPRLAFAVEDPPYIISKLRQRFDASSTALQVLQGKDLNDCTAVVTGANSGIGFETARSLVFHGCKVFFACRNQIAAEKAIRTITNEKPEANSLCHYLLLDLASLKSVQQFATNIKQNVRHISFLILNAGLFGLPYIKTVDGFEMTFQVCHLSHFYLTLQLENLFDSNSRIIVVSAESHRFAGLSKESLTIQNLLSSPEKYWSISAYNNAKLCNILFAKELADRWKHRGVSVFSVHPGNLVSSNIQRNWWFYRLLFATVRPFTKSLQQAAATTIYCAVAEELNGLTGFYFNNCFFCEPCKSSKNISFRQELWRISEQLLNETLSTN